VLLDERRRYRCSSSAGTLGRVLADGALVFAPGLRGEHVELVEKLEFKILEQRQRLGSHDIEELVDRSLSLQGSGGFERSFLSLRALV
jgi:hypothetical protein